MYQGKLRYLSSIVGDFWGWEWICLMDLGDWGLEKTRLIWIYCLEFSDWTRWIFLPLVLLLLERFLWYMCRIYLGVVLYWAISPFVSRHLFVYDAVYFRSIQYPMWSRLVDIWVRWLTSQPLTCSVVMITRSQLTEQCPGRPVFISRHRKHCLSFLSSNLGFER